MPNISAMIVFHGERFLAPVSIQSFKSVCDEAVAHGLSIERIAILDRADELTGSIVEAESSAFDHVLLVDSVDLGLKRNAGIEAASGEYAAFFDGDDLWGSQWLWRAFEHARNQTRPHVAHPEIIHYFSSNDYTRQSQTEFPAAAGLQSFYMVQRSSLDIEFDAKGLIINNMWTANCFAKKNIYVNFPYAAIDRSSGFGVEDWSWNAETVANGIHHTIVPDTVHCIRLKSEGSLGLENARTKLLPRVHKFARQLTNL